MKIDDYLQRFTLLHPKSIDLSLDRILRLLHRLGNPQKSLPPTIHVAGTNGKGSVVAFARAILRSAGCAVHVYTSPHLVRFNERIRLPGGLIADDELEALFEECDKANGSEPITFFEITTVAAFLAFSRQPADYLVLEVGLGGRLDTTNTCETTAVSVITSISYDHQRFLGDTLAAIAAEKAGIMRRDVPVISALQTAEVSEVLAARATATGARFLRHGEDWNRTDASSPSFRLGDRNVVLGAPSLVGAHQNDNAALAAAATLLLGDPRVTEDALRRGIASAIWPARLQQLDDGPLRALLGKGGRLWLDGGHNESAGEALAVWAADAGVTHAIVGMMETKDATKFLTALARGVGNIHCIAIPGEEKAFGADELAARASAAGLRATTHSSVRDALSSIAADHSAPRVLVCGSLYLAGTVLDENGTAVK